MRNSAIRPLLCALLYLIFGASLSCSPQSSPHPSPRAEKGNLDLSQWDFSRNGTVELNGEWDCYWNELLSPADIIANKSVPSFLLELPCEWNHRTVNGSPLPGFGYATHRLKVKLSRKYDILALNLQDMSTAYRLYVNGILISGNGSVGKSREESVPQILPRVVIFPVNDDSLDMVLQVSNFHHRLGGPWFPIKLGTETQIRNMRERRISLDLFLFGSLLIIGFYHIALFSLRTKDRSPLYLSAFTFLMALRIIVQGEDLMMHYIPTLPFEAYEKLNYLTFYLAVPVFSTFIHSVFPGEFPRRVLRAIQILFGAFSALVVMTPARVYTHTFIYCEFLTIIICVYIICVIILAIVRKREEARISLIAFAVVFLTIVNDMLYGHFLFGAEFLIPLGYFFYIFAQAFILSKRFSRAFTTAENLTMELEQKNIDLQRFDSLKDQFLANTSHELRTPLKGIISIADSLVAGATGPLPRNTLHDLSLIVSSGKRLSGLIGDILDFSRIKNNDIRLSFSKTDLKTITDMAIELNRSSIDPSRMIVRNSIGDDLPSVVADRDRLQQIMLNLLNNAIKFTETGTIEVTASVVEIGEKYLEASVSDTGIGIPEERIGSIFNLFEQADGSLSQRLGGTGLGLAITKELIELHGGTISVTSEVGKGSVFTFRIPYRPESDISPAGEAPVALAPHVPMTPSVETVRQFDYDLSVEPGKEGADETVFIVMVVDDDLINCRVLENHLVLSRYAVIVAMSGQEALDIIENEIIPDIILLDIMMPKVSGLEVLKRLRRRFTPHELPVMLITAKNQPQDIVLGFEAGANDYLQKPFDKHELLARVKTLVTLKKAVQETWALTSIRKEIEIARSIQQGIIPKTAPSMTGLDIQTLYIPMERVGGDFFCFQAIDETKIGIMISDVTGHGVPAALVASMAQMITSLLKHAASDPGNLIKEINSIFIANIEHQYITAGYLFIDRDKKIISYARAGHEPLILYKRSESKLTEHLPRGLIIGLKQDSIYETADASIEPGDRILLYTDCITETVNDQLEFFGYNRFHDFILDNAHLNARQFCSHLRAYMEDWSGGKVRFDDDFTLIVIDVL